MKNIYTTDFKSKVDIDGLLQAAKKVLPNLRWGIRESEYDDRYLLGKFEGDGKIRILDYDEYQSAEIYFTENNPQEFRADLSAKVTEFIKGLPNSIVIKEY